MESASHNDLTNDDLDSLARSYIPPELARWAGLYRVDSCEGGRIVGRNGTGNYAGIVFPYNWPGEAKPYAYRLRRDKPDLERSSDGTIKEKGKYLSAPGDGNRLYFAPDAVSAWLQDVSLPIIITEGEKKTLALSRLASDEKAGGQPRFLSIGVSGVWNFRSTVGKANDERGARRDVKGVISDFDRIKWQGDESRTVYIIYDANVATNQSVAVARHTLAKELTRRGATVRFVDLPQLAGVNGVDAKQ